MESETRTHNFADDQKVFLRVDYKDTESPLYYYQYDNHLGSSCLELNENGAIISYEEYHPFGTTSYQIHGNNVEVSLKRYKYCGKERDEETGLYYYGARYYAAWLCRFISVDPLKDKYPGISPYVYCANNPIAYIDPDGRDRVYFYDKNGKLVYEDRKTGTNNILFRNEQGKEVLFNKANLDNKHENKIFKDILYEQLKTIQVDTATGKGLEYYGYSPKFPNKGAHAYAIFEKGTILLNTNREFSNDMYEIQSTFRHEYLHLAKETGSFLDHANVYKDQMSYPEFAKTSPEFQKSILRAYAIRLYNAVCEPTTLSLDEIQKSMDEFNKTTGQKLGMRVDFKWTAADVPHHVEAISVYIKKPYFINHETQKLENFNQ